MPTTSKSCLVSSMHSASQEIGENASRSQLGWNIFQCLLPEFISNSAVTIRCLRAESEVNAQLEHDEVIVGGTDGYDSHHRAAVRTENPTRIERSLFRSQECHRVGDILRPTPASEWDLSTRVIVVFLRKRPE